MILVDTSVWVDHLRRGNANLRLLLAEGQVLCHPFIAGEIAMGQLKERDHILGLLKALPEALVAEHGEVMQLVNSRRLFGRGLGWLDAHLLAAALLSQGQLWTNDKALASAAGDLRMSWTRQ